MCASAICGVNCNSPSAASEAANNELRATVKVLEQDQQAGRQVQLRMLPTTPLVLDDYVISHTVIPSLYLSGDFTDYFTVGSSS